MATVIKFTAPGGPDVLEVQEVDLAPPGAGEVQVKNHAVGLNYIDTYHRSGLYPVPLPSGIGLEAAGEVVAVGAGVSSFAVGDRVATGRGPLGAYASEMNVPEDSLVSVPDAVSHETAAAMMLKGLTTQYLLRQTFRVEPGQTILFHAAAGGVGLIACQWARHLGVTTIGTAGSVEKAQLARDHGCHHTILYREENVVERVKDITGGKMVPVVYDGVGKDTFEISLDCLAPLGMMVSFGSASGTVEPVDLGQLASRGSLFLTRPTLMTYAASTEALRAMSAELFDVVAQGAVKIDINQRYALSDAVQAHKDLEDRKTTGSTVLLP